MISAEWNERLTRVGPGTPMGNLLRRYWHPVAIERTMTEHAARKVRLLGEDLVLYRDKQGQYGLVDELCPHRSCSLEYGIPEEHGLRCPYHGWLFDETGQCLEQPAEPANSTFKHRVKMKAYKVEALGGLIFAYLGPDPAPLLPRYDLFVEDAVKAIGHCMIPCNWLQTMENSVDPTHTEYLHGHYFNYIKGGPETNTQFTRRHVKIGFDVVEYGIIKRRILEGHTEEDDDWRIGHPLVFPNMLKHGGQGRYQFQIRVPVDDTHTWHIWYVCHRPDGATIPANRDIVDYVVPFQDENGKFLLDFIDGQDIMAWVTQGPIADRTREKLGSSDKGVILYRKVLQEQLARVEDGQDPMGLIRDPEANVCVAIPVEQKKGHFGKKAHLDKTQAKFNPKLQEIMALFEQTNP